MLLALAILCASGLDKAEAAAIVGASECDVQYCVLERSGEDVASLVVSIEGSAVQFDCSRFSNRAVGYRVLEDTGGGQLREHAPGPIQTWRGRSSSGFQIALSEDEDGGRGLILAPDGERWWIESLYGRHEVAEHGIHAVFRGSGVERPNGWCGVAENAIPTSAGSYAAAHRSRDAIVYTAELAADADYEYFQNYGSIVAVELTLRRS